jgi:RNA polymerase sigma-70 factor, ECF subfamily
MDNTALTQLMLASGQGDAAAYRKLAHALGPRMHALAARLLSGDMAGAEDAVQEALIKLWQHAPAFQPTGSVAGYAGRLVYTACMDMHRSRKPTEDAAAYVPVEPESTTSGIFQKQQRKSVLEAIGQLPERQAEAVTLSYFHDFQMKEIAATMDTTESAIESLLVRARRTLAATLPRHLMGGPLTEGAPTQTYIKQSEAS